MKGLKHIIVVIITVLTSGIFAGLRAQDVVINPIYDHTPPVKMYAFPGSIKEGNIILTGPYTIKETNTASGYYTGMEWQKKSLGSGTWQNTGIKTPELTVDPSTLGSGCVFRRKVTAVSNQNVLYTNEVTLYNAAATGYIDVLPEGQGMELDFTWIRDQYFSGHASAMKVTVTRSDRQLYFTAFHQKYIGVLTMSFQENPTQLNLSETVTVRVSGTDPETGDIIIVNPCILKFRQPSHDGYSTGIIKMEKVTEEEFNGSDYNKSVTYFDRYGRVDQQISLAASPSGKDIVRFYEYDSMGRADSIAYLPYSVAGTGGVKRSSPKTEQVGFYRSLFPSADDYDYAYSSKEYDKSPLGMVLKSGAPGKIYSKEENPVTYDLSLAIPSSLIPEYQLSIKKYRITSDSLLTLSPDLHYNYGELIVKKVTKKITEDQTAISYEYRNNADQLIAKESYISVEDRRFTYYVYDDLGRQRYVIPPIAVEKYLSVMTDATQYSPADLNEYCHYREYDEYGRVSKSLKPGQEYEYFVYDKRGHLVLHQDANLRSLGRWRYMVYDEADRLVEKCIVEAKYPDMVTRESLQKRYYSSSFDNTYPYLGGTDNPLVPLSNASFLLCTHLESIRYDDYSMLQSFDHSTAFIRYEENTYLYMPYAFNMENVGIRDIPGMWSYFVKGGTVKPEYAVKNGSAVVAGYYYIPEDKVDLVRNIAFKVNSPGMMRVVTQFPGNGYPDLGYYPDGKPAAGPVKYVKNKYFKIGNIPPSSNPFPSVYDPNGRYFDNCRNVRSEYLITAGYYYIPESCLELVQMTIALGGPYEIVTTFPGSGAPLEGYGDFLDLATALEFEPYNDLVTDDMLAVSNFGRKTFEKLAILDGGVSSGYVYRAFYYDRRGRLIQTKELNWDGNESCHWIKYDAAGNVVTTLEGHQTDQREIADYKRVDMTYDSHGRLLSEETTVDGPASEFTASRSFAYDELGRLKTKVSGGVPEGFAYNFHGALTDHVSPLFQENFTYGRYDGNITSATWSHSESQTLPMMYQYSYDESGQLIAAYHCNHKGVRDRCFDEEVQYDMNGNITNMRRTGSTPFPVKTYAYMYDGNKLTLVGSKTGEEYYYSYDDMGNMIVDSRKNLRFNYNSLNLISAIGDANSNTLRARYSWLADGTKIGCRDYSGNGFRYKGSFTYDMNDRLVSVEFNGGEFAVAHADPSPGAARSYTPHYHLTDYLGSVRVVHDGSGAVSARNDYYPFGLRYENASYLMLDNPKVNRFMFNGKERQVTGIDLGLLDYGSRMYDPFLGRWFTPDPAMQLINPYIFCGNNPASNLDADGEWFWNVLLGGVINVISDLISGNLNKSSSWKDWALSFGIGAVTGLVGFHVGGALAGAGIGGFFNGAISGAATGFSAGLVSGTGRGLINHQGFGQALMAGLKQGFVGSLTGAAVGGTISGITSGIKGNNFWDGSKRKMYEFAQKSHPAVKQAGEYNCGGAAMESLSDGSLSQYDVRTLAGETLENINTTGLNKYEVYGVYAAESGRPFNVYNQGEWWQTVMDMNRGKDITYVMGTELNGMGHAVNAHSVSVNFITKVNGERVTKIFMRVMDPARGGFVRYRYDKFNPSSAFFFSPSVR